MTQLMPHPPSTDRVQLLQEVALILEQHFVFDAYGRLLVEVAREGEALVVRDVLVEQIVGDEAAVDAAFGSPEAHALIPAIAHAVEALCVLEGVELAHVSGGTFIRIPPASAGEAVTHASSALRVAFLPGLLRTPSTAFDALRDQAVTAMRAANEALAERAEVRVGMSVATDMVLGTVSFARDGVIVARGRQVVLGSFSRAHRSWVWGGSNPSLVSEARQRAKELLDTIADRSAWEIATPGFPTDEPTAWALASWVAHEMALQGIFRVDAGAGGFVVLGLSDVERADGTAPAEQQHEP